MRKLGQHFLISQNVAKKIVEAADITKKDTVLEIGTGTGILVPLLCKQAGHVVSVEYDKALYDDSCKKFAGLDNLTLVHGDGFQSNVAFSILVSNLPYYKSRDAVEWLAQKKYSHGIIMVQKEFAEKLFSKTDRAVSVIANHTGELKKIMDVGKNNFSPKPQVDSVVLSIQWKKAISEELIQAVNRLYSYKRKTIQNIAKQFGFQIQSDKRLEDLSDSEIISLAKKLIKK